MSTLHRIALLGFSAFERNTLGSYFRLASTREPRYEQVALLPDADFVVADADHEPSVKLVLAVERLPETVFVGARAPEGAIAWLARPIDPMRVLRELDAMAARRMAQPGGHPRESAGHEDDRRRTVVQPVRPARPAPPTALLLGSTEPSPSGVALDLDLTSPGELSPTAPARGERAARELDQRPARGTAPIPRAAPSAAAVPAVFTRPAPAEAGGTPLAPSGVAAPAAPIEPRVHAPGVLAQPPVRQAPEPGATPPTPLASSAPAAPLGPHGTPKAPGTPTPPATPAPPTAHAPLPAAAAPTRPAAAMPADAAKVATPRPVVVPRPPADAPPRTALLVDDSEVALRFLQKRLAPYGLATEGVAGSDAALKRLGEQRFDFVFLDMELGERSALDGLALCQHIKQQPDPAVVVMVTAHHTELDRVRAALAGCDGFLGKPLEETELALYLVRHGFKLPANVSRLVS